MKQIYCYKSTPNQLFETNNFNFSTIVFKKLVFAHNVLKSVSCNSEKQNFSNKILFEIKKNRVLIRRFFTKRRYFRSLQTKFESYNRKIRSKELYSRVMKIHPVSKFRRIRLFKLRKLSRYIAFLDKRKFFSKRSRRSNFIKFFSSIFGVGQTRCFLFSSVFGLSRSQNLFSIPISKISLIIRYIKKTVVLERLLRKRILSNLEKKKRLGLYVSVRLEQGLPSRGQRTKTNARTSKSRKSLMARRIFSSPVNKKKINFPKLTVGNNKQIPKKNSQKGKKTNKKK